MSREQLEALKASLIQQYNDNEDAAREEELREQIAIVECVLMYGNLEEVAK